MQFHGRVIIEFLSCLCVTIEFLSCLCVTIQFLSCICVTILEFLSCLCVTIEFLSCICVTNQNFCPVFVLLIEFLFYLYVTIEFRSYFFLYLPFGPEGPKWHCLFCTCKKVKYRLAEIMILGHGGDLNSGKFPYVFPSSKNTRDRARKCTLPWIYPVPKISITCQRNII